MPFLGLPREMRNMIYAHTAVFKDTHFSAYHGLYLSCRRVRTEMDEECGRVLTSHLNAIRAGMDANIEKMDIGSSLLEQLNPRVQVVITQIDFGSSTSKALLIDLLGLYLTSLTLVVDVNRHFLVSFQVLWGVRDGLREKGIHTKRIVIQTSTLDEISASVMVHTDWNAGLDTDNKTGDGYRFRWYIGKDRKCSAIFDPKPGLGATFEEPSSDEVQRALQGL
jgi:hypothetical protein